MYHLKLWILPLSGLITRFVYDSMFWGRNEPNTGRNRPLLIAYEEAHSYLGKNDTIYAKEAVERIFKEGRKFGLGASCYIAKTIRTIGNDTCSGRNIYCVTSYKFI